MELHMLFLVQVVLYMIHPKSNVFGQQITHVLEVEEQQQLHHHLLQQQQLHLLQEQQQQLHLLQQQQQLQVPLQVLDVDFLNGKETDTAMTKTTMMVAIMMVEIVAVTMSTRHIVLLVNVLILNLETMIVKIPGGHPGVKVRRIKGNVPGLLLLANVKKLV